jgi:hypothetical protein
VIASLRADLREMAEQDQQCQVDIVELTYSEELGQDEGSDWYGERFYLSPQSVFKKMLHVATHMSQKDRQVQKVLLSLAMQAIERVEKDSRSDVKREKKMREAVRGKHTPKKETQEAPLGSLSPASSRVEKRWSPEEFVLVKNLREKSNRWVDIAKHHFPGRTGNQIRAQYVSWLQKNKDFEDEEKMFEEEPNRAEKFGSEIGWSN